MSVMGSKMANDLSELNKEGKIETKILLSGYESPFVSGREFPSLFHMLEQLEREGNRQPVMHFNDNVYYLA